MPARRKTYPSTHGPVKVHSASTCTPPCPFHAPSVHPLSKAPIYIRMDKFALVERICEHGVGHPDPDSLAYRQHLSAFAVHGCDGCCASYRLPIDTEKP